MKLVILMIASMMFSSCMHMGMMGTGDGHHSGVTHEMNIDPVLEKEVIVGDVRAIAFFPPLEYGKEVSLTLRLLDRRTSTPISGATVYLHAQYFHRVARDEDGHHDQTRLGREEREHDISVDQEVLESEKPGVYTILYGSNQPGEHTLMFHIAVIDDQELEPEIIVEATKTIPAEGHQHQSGMMEGTNMATYVIIGGAVMGAVMIAMMAARGGIF